MLQADMCLCYESLSGIGVPANCDAVNCPGNSFEQCGISHMIVYRKGKPHFSLTHETPV